MLRLSKLIKKNIYKKSDNTWAKQQKKKVRVEYFRTYWQCKHCLMDKKLLSNARQTQTLDLSPLSLQKTLQTLFDRYLILKINE